MDQVLHQVPGSGRPSRIRSGEWRQPGTAGCLNTIRTPRAREQSCARGVFWRRMGRHRGRSVELRHSAHRFPNTLGCEMGFFTLSDRLPRRRRIAADGRVLAGAASASLVLLWRGMEFFWRSARKPCRLGVFPGTFNPVTVAHMALAEGALAVVDEVVFILPRQFPHKTYCGASFEQRVELLGMVLGGESRYSVAASERGLFAEIAGECRSAYGADARLSFLDRKSVV